jgi:putrescine:ornithine antiporter
MQKTNTMDLINIVILNCIGSGILLLPPKLARIGVNAIYAWGITAFGAISIGLLFTRLTTGKMHDIVSEPFKKLGEPCYKFVRRVVFYGYFIFAFAGNSLFAIRIVDYLCLVFPRSLEPVLLLLVFILVHLLNRFGKGNSRLVSQVLVWLKFMILLVFPLLSVLKLWITNGFAFSTGFDFSWIRQPITIPKLSYGMFITLWAYFGIESVSVESNVSQKKLTRAISIGSALCLIIYILNTSILFSMVPSIETSGSCYSSLFMILFGKYSDLITNVASFIVFFGMLHGWTGASVSTLEGGSDLIPEWVYRVNKHGSPEIAILISGVLALGLVYFLKYFVRSESVSDFIMDSSTSICLIVYLLSIVALVIKRLLRFKVSRSFYLDLGIGLVSGVYCITAFYGAPINANLVALVLSGLLGLLKLV